MADLFRTFALRAGHAGIFGYNKGTTSAMQLMPNPSTTISSGHFSSMNSRIIPLVSPFPASDAKSVTTRREQVTTCDYLAFRRGRQHEHLRIPGACVVL
jgi:hypothetical protein